jgi:hypothetical protein
MNYNIIIEALLGVVLNAQKVRIAARDKFVREVNN